jgi:hypothetical protein
VTRTTAVAGVERRSSRGPAGDGDDSLDLAGVVVDDPAGRASERLEVRLDG